MNPKHKRLWDIIVKIILCAATAVTAIIGTNEVNKSKTKEGPMPVSDSSIIAAANLADTATNAYMQGNANKKNRKFAEKMYTWQRQDALADWNMQNAYNSPAAQIARLKEAGLNPALIYGDGGSIMQASTVRSADMTQGHEQPLTGTRLGEGMRDYFSVRMQNAQLENMDLQNKKLAAETSSVLGSTNMTQFDLDRKKELAMQIIEDAWASTGLKKAQIDATAHGNQRAQELQPEMIKNAKAINTLAGWNIANARLDNAMKKMQNNQYDQMRPLELAKANAELIQLAAQLQKTRQETTNEREITRINKMEADLGKVIRMTRELLSKRR